MCVSVCMHTHEHMWDTESKLGPWLPGLGCVTASVLPVHWGWEWGGGHPEGPCCLYPTTWRPGWGGGCISGLGGLVPFGPGLSTVLSVAMRWWSCAAGTCTGHNPRLDPQRWGFEENPLESSLWIRLYWDAQLVTQNRHMCLLVCIPTQLTTSPEDEEQNALSRREPWTTCGYPHPVELNSHISVTKSLPKLESSQKAHHHTCVDCG